MFKLTLRGVVPIEEVPFEKDNRFNRDHEEFHLEKSDFLAMYIAAMQTFMPILLFFAGAYFLAILFITEVWIK